MQSSSCALCAKPCVVKQQCSTCKNTMYCGRECQVADWKQHKKRCVKPSEPLLKPLQRSMMRRHVFKLEEDEAWGEIMSHYKYIDQLVMDKEPMHLQTILNVFARAYCNFPDKTPNAEHATALIDIYMRRARSLKSDFESSSLLTVGFEASTLVTAGFACISSTRYKMALYCFEQARVALTKCFLLKVEVESMVGLAIVCLEKHFVTSVAGGTRDDGLNMLRSAVFASTLIEDKARVEELYAYRSLLHYLVKDEDTLDEALEQAVVFRALALQTSIDLEKFSVSVVHAYMVIARVYQSRNKRKEFQETVVEMLTKMCKERTTTKSVADDMLLALGKFGRNLYGASFDASIQGDIRKQWETEVYALQTITGITA